MISISVHTILDYRVNDEDLVFATTNTSSTAWTPHVFLNL